MDILRSRDANFLRIPFFMAYVNKMLEMIGAPVNILQFLIVEIRMELLRNICSACWN